MRYALVTLRETRYAAWAVQDGMDGVLAARLVARNAGIVASCACGPLAERLPGAARGECGARMDAQRLSGVARDEVRSTSLRE